MAREAIKRKRQSAEKRGHMAEYIAALYLFAKGYRILSLRYKTALGEIDIVAKRSDSIVFIEVKRRAGYSQAIDAVNYHSQQRIRSASDLWMARHPNAQRYSTRYDIIAIRPLALPRHVINAF